MNGHYKAENYNRDFVNANMMGPNSARLKKYIVEDNLIFPEINDY
jgi:hypothetical protein